MELMWCKRRNRPVTVFNRLRAGCHCQEWPVGNLLEFLTENRLPDSWMRADVTVTEINDT